MTLLSLNKYIYYDAIYTKRTTTQNSALCPMGTYACKQTHRKKSRRIYTKLTAMFPSGRRIRFGMKEQVVTGRVSR